MIYDFSDFLTTCCHNFFSLKLGWGSVPLRPTASDKWELLLSYFAGENLRSVALVAQHCQPPLNSIVHLKILCKRYPPFQFQKIVFFRVERVGGHCNQSVGPNLNSVSLKTSNLKVRSKSRVNSYRYILGGFFLRI